MATNLALMHLGDNVHGDLTTSNMMIRPRLPVQSLFSIDSGPMTAYEIIQEASSNGGDIGDLYFIDFGLSCVSQKIEDKAVDIYVLKRAFISTHPGSEHIWDQILEAYREIMVSK
jgi:tRNA A-37 threonylcarbamoyl transferase component Bud32